MRCRVCSKPTVPLVNVPGMPKGVRTFTDEVTILKVCQCPVCGLVQLENDPPEYWVRNYRACIPADTQERLEDFPGAVDVDRWPEPRPIESFTLLNYLEHVPYPALLMSTIWDMLPEGGRGLVEVPNLENAVSEKLVTEFCADHVSYFTRGSLAYVLDRTGFDYEIEITESGHTLSAEVTKRSQTLDLSWVKRKKAKVEKPYCVWGAGHHGLASIVMYRLAPEFIVDSDPNKAGHSFSGIPIVDPAYLEEHPMKVLVIAAGYSEEIAEKCGGIVFRGQPC